MPDPTDAVSDVLNKLAAQGSARQIADYLVAEQCAGNRNAGTACPVARYVQRATGHHVYVDGVSWTDQVGDEHPIPDDVSEFVEYFDEGRFPELDADANLVDVGELS